MARITEDKVFDYLADEEKRLFNLYTEEKKILEEYIRNNEWKKALIEITTLQSIDNQLLLIASMVEAHECEDI